MSSVVNTGRVLQTWVKRKGKSKALPHGSASPGAAVVGMGGSDDGKAQAPSISPAERKTCAGEPGGKRWIPAAGLPSCPERWEPRKERGVLTVGGPELRPQLPFPPTLSS